MDENSMESQFQKEIDLIVQNGLNTWKVDVLKIIEDIKNIYKNGPSAQQLKARLAECTSALTSCERELREAKKYVSDVSAEYASLCVKYREQTRELDLVREEFAKCTGTADLDGDGGSGENGGVSVTIKNEPAEPEDQFREREFQNRMRDNVDNMERALEACSRARTAAAEHSSTAATATTMTAAPTIVAMSLPSTAISSLSPSSATAPATATVISASGEKSTIPILQPIGTTTSTGAAAAAASATTASGIIGTIVPLGLAAGATAVNMNALGGGIQRSAAQHIFINSAPSNATTNTTAAATTIQSQPLIRMSAPTTTAPQLVRFAGAQAQHHQQQQSSATTPFNQTRMNSSASVTPHSAPPGIRIHSQQPQSQLQKAPSRQLPSLPPPRPILKPMPTSTSLSNLNGQTLSPQTQIHLNNNVNHNQSNNSNNIRAGFPKMMDKHMPNLPSESSYNPRFISNLGPNLARLHRSSNSNSSQTARDEDMDDIQVIESINPTPTQKPSPTQPTQKQTGLGGGPPELTAKQLEDLFNTSPSIEAFSGRLLKYYFTDKELSKVNPSAVISNGTSSSSAAASAAVGSKPRGGSLACLDPARMALIKKHITSRIDTGPTDNGKLWLDCVHRMQIVIHRVRKRHEVNMISRLTQQQHMQQQHGWRMQAQQLQQHHHQQQQHTQPSKF